MAPVLIFRPIIEKLLSRADVAISGNRPWDITVHDHRFFPKVLLQGSLGLGESYMLNYWSTDDLEEFFYRLINAKIENISHNLPPHIISKLVDRILNQQTKSKALHNAEHHYNLGNDLFFGFLGKYRNYSCGYYQNASCLDDAQLAKMERVCKLLKLGSSDRLLDVGGGWGEFARFAASNFGCHVTSINIADEQIRYAVEYCKGTSVKVQKKDYRDIAGRFSKIAVLAMFTHVGQKNYRSFMEKMHRCLEPGGKMIMETVGGKISKTNCDPWVNKYFFMGGMIPSLEQIDNAIDGLFIKDSIYEFGLDYVYTLREWYKNFTLSWPSQNGLYSETIRRMFEYFFLSVAGAFRAKDLLHWHIVFSKLPLVKKEMK